MIKKSVFPGLKIKSTELSTLTDVTLWIQSQLASFFLGLVSAPSGRSSRTFQPFHSDGDVSDCLLMVIWNIDAFEKGLQWTGNLHSSQTTQRAFDINKVSTQCCSFVQNHFQIFLFELLNRPCQNNSDDYPIHMLQHQPFILYQVTAVINWSNCECSLVLEMIQALHSMAASSAVMQTPAALLTCRPQQHLPLGMCTGWGNSFSSLSRILSMSPSFCNFKPVYVCQLQHYYLAIPPWSRIMHITYLINKVWKYIFLKTVVYMVNGVFVLFCFK